MAFSSPSSSPLERAFTLLQHANELEDQGCLDGAYQSYQDAIKSLKLHVQSMERQEKGQHKFLNSDWHATKQLINEKIRHYENHSQQLQTDSKKKTYPRKGVSKVAEETAGVPATQLKHDDVKRGGSWEQQQTAATAQAAISNAYLSVALRLDETGEKQAAIDKYLSAAEALLPAIKLLLQAEEEDAPSDNTINTTTKGDYQSTIYLTLSRRLQSIMDRVEELKVICSTSKSTKEPSTSAPPVSTITLEATKETSASAPLLSTKTLQAGLGRRQTKLQSYCPASKLTPEEIEVLKRASLISSGVFLPWMDEEVFTFDFTNNGNLWNDPDGVLKLSPTQKETFYAWKRPSDIVAMQNASFVNPKKIGCIKMIQSITPYTICQKAITDCSFIASLCVCAAYERRFGKRLVTSIIYPQDRNGIPIYNKYGVYMVKLWLNGVARRVLVDDFLPVDRQGNLLCSHTAAIAGNREDNAFEFWVPIIEKAYMKLCGGYDFPGSNSTVDLFSLTGWIPERIYLAESDKDVKDFETHRERAWERLYFASNLGDCLVTLANESNLPEEVTDKIGLVTNHAYAVLSVIKTRSGIRLLQLKNPWAQKSWRGRFSCHDKVRWADKGLQMEVGYDPAKASEYDDGVFWICWEDVLVYFSKINLSWNPTLFSSKVTVHGFWPATQGPANDSFNITENPQYTMTMSDQAIQSKSSLWILLSRHVDKYEQEGAETEVFLTPFLHRNTSNVDLILYPSSKTCVFAGAYTNSPHILARYDIEGPKDKFLSVVLSRHHKSKDLGYTLSCYCTGSFTLSLPIKTPSHVTELLSEWTESTAGGNPSNPSFVTNPQWRVILPEGGALIQLKCYAPKTIFINIMLLKSVNGSSSARQNLVVNSGATEIDTGDYRCGFAASAVKFIPHGSYILVASTFEPGEKGPYVLTIHSSTKDISVSKL